MSKKSVTTGGVVFKLIRPNRSRLTCQLIPLRGSPMTSILLTLDLIRLTPDPDDPSEVACPRCHASLLLHQPDQQMPERLLGTCAECQTWFLINAIANVMVRLPDEQDFRDA